MKFRVVGTVVVTSALAVEPVYHAWSGEPPVPPEGQPHVELATSTGSLSAVMELNLNFPAMTNSGLMDGAPRFITYPILGNDYTTTSVRCTFFGPGPGYTESKGS